MTGNIYKFCQITSVKGIPRLLKAKSFFMRIVWAVSVSGFLCVAAIQSILLTMEYYNYKTYTYTGEVLMGFVEKNDEVVGTPDITLCNTNPFASNNILDRGFPTMEEYSRLVDQATTCDDNCTEEDCATLNYIRERMMTTSAYFDYIGRHNAKQLGHSRESFLPYCVLDMEGGVYGHRIPCQSATQIIQIQYTTFFNCYTIRLPRNEYPDKMHTGFLAVLHLDDYSAVHDEQSLLAPHDEAGQMSGVWVFVHEAGTPPRNDKNRILLQPGHFHDTPVKMALRTYLPPPYGVCLDIDGKEYDSYQCFSKCLQTRIYKRCGCLDLQNYTSQLETCAENGTPCLSLSIDKNKLIKNGRCSWKEKTKGSDECEIACPWRCKKMDYTLRVCRCLCPVWYVGNRFIWFSQFVLLCIIWAILLRE